MVTPHARRYRAGKDRHPARVNIYGSSRWQQIFCGRAYELLSRHFAAFFLLMTTKFVQ